jgi:hypothetical protein
MTQNINNQKYFIAIRDTVNNDDLQQFKHLINCDNFSCINKEDKDEIVFFAAYYSKNKEFMNYLIFDYNIEVNEFIKRYLRLSNNLKKAFEMREMKKELNINLEENKPKLKL